MDSLDQMISYEKPDDKSAMQAKFDAQKIAFGPVVFHGIKALRDLGILKLLHEKKNEGISLQEIAKTLNLSKYGVGVLLEVGLSSDVVRMVGENYVLTKTGYFLLTDKMTSVNMNFVSDVCYQGLPELKASIEEGKPKGLKSLGDWETIYEGLSSLPKPVQKSWFEFDHYYSDAAFPEVLPLVFERNPKHLVDVGGNTGKFALQCAQYSKDIQITILDLPGQLAKAMENVKSHGYESRVQGKTVNWLDEHCEFPVKNADVIWMSQFLDCFSHEEIVSVLRRAREAMNDSTSLFILETLWDRQQYEAAAFCLHNTSLYFTCLANGNSKMYHSGEFIECVKEAGLEIVLDKDLDNMGHTLLECRRA